MTTLDDQMKNAEALLQAADLPDGDYAIVELLGHRTLIGRIREVERFGAKFIGIEVIFNGRLLPEILHGGSSIYGLTPCSRERASTNQATSPWQLPETLRNTAPPALLAPPQGDLPFGTNIVPDEEDDGDMRF